MPHRVIRIATRKSALALWQAEYVKHMLVQSHSDISVELVPMSTTGDKILDTPLAKVGGKGLFIKELEIAMLEGRADIAVHSMKDVPMDLPEGFGLHAICARENPYDAFVSNSYNELDALPQGSVVGTSSLRRQCQLKHLRPDLIIKDLRGNVNTRLAKLDEGQYDAIILAAAGLIRLGMAERIASQLSSQQSLPAVGQGAVGIECRDDDTDLIARLACMHNPDSAIRVRAERAMNKRLEGGCQVPIAGFSELDKGMLTLRGAVGAVDGSRLIYAEQTGKLEQATDIGEQVAEQLLQQGAGELLRAAHL